jgi:hypothetical protein
MNQMAKGPDDANRKIGRPSARKDRLAEMSKHTGVWPSLEEENLKIGRVWWWSGCGFPVMNGYGMAACGGYRCMSIAILLASYSLDFSAGFFWRLRVLLSPARRKRDIGAVA